LFTSTSSRPNLAYAVEHPFVIFTAGDVGLAIQHRRSGRFELLDRVGYVAGITSAVDGDVETALGELEGDAKTDAAAAAGDEGYFFCRRHFVFSKREAIHRFRRLQRLRIRTELSYS